MSILPLGAVVGAVPVTAPAAPVAPGVTNDALGGAAAGDGAGGGFASALGKAMDSVSGLQQTADTYAVQAATGTATNLHDVTIASTEAQLATQLTVAVRDKAVSAFNSIMQMPV